MSADDMVLDDIDRALILAIYRIRRSTDAGPTWGEVREEVGLERPDVSIITFGQWWSDQANREAMEADHLERFITKHPNAADAAWFRYCYGVWRSRRMDNLDPLTLRLQRLRAAGYVSYNRSVRSLDVGGRVRAELRRQAKARKSA
jgi:hypothetical protein